MKKAFVLIVALLFISRFTLLAQINKTDSGASAIDTAKATFVPKKPDTVASAKTEPKSLVNQASPAKADTKSTLKDTVATSAAKVNKTDSAATSSKPLADQVSPVKTDDKSTLKDTTGVSAKATKIDAGLTTTPAKTNSKAKAASSGKKGSLKIFGKKNKVNSEEAKQDSAILALRRTGIDTSITDSAKRIKRDISFLKARPFPLPEANVNNINFFHRYWRDIDLQEPKNKKFATYHAALITALLDAVKEKTIKAYNPAGGTPQNPTGDAFTVPISYNELMSGLSDTSLVDEFDKDGNKIGSKSVPNPFTPDKIAGYRIKEDVYLDKTRSRTITRIVGIAPLVKLTLSSGEIISIQPLCWLRFKDCRNVLVTIDIDPTKKIGDSMDDVFLQRRFYGKIIQESNPEGIRIKDYKTDPADQLTEANRIEQKVTKFKKGSWVYTMLNVSSDTTRAAKPVAKAKKIKVKLPSVK